MAKAPFTLPRIQASDSIVDQTGRPTTRFLKFFNFDFARAIERNDASQQAVLDQLAAQLLLIQQAQEAADAAQATAEAAATGSAAYRADIAAEVVTTSFATVVTAPFPSRLANGFWDFTVTMNGYGDGLTVGDLDIQVRESGAALPLATATVTVPPGPPSTSLVVAFTPAGPYNQTRPAGDIDLILEARKTFPGDKTVLGGQFFASYVPEAAP